MPALDQAQIRPLRALGRTDRGQLLEAGGARRLRAGQDALCQGPRGHAADGHWHPDPQPWDEAVLSNSAAGGDPAGGQRPLRPPSLGSGSPQRRGPPWGRCPPVWSKPARSACLRPTEHWRSGAMECLSGTEIPLWLSSGVEGGSTGSPVALAGVVPPPPMSDYRRAARNAAARATGRPA